MYQTSLLATRVRLRVVGPPRPSCGDLPSEVEAVAFDDDSVEARVPVRSIRVREPASLLEVEAIARIGDARTALMSNKHGFLAAELDTDEASRLALN